MIDEHTIIGLTEQITILAKEEKDVVARIDTGATKSSMDSTLAKQLGLGPVISNKLVRSAHGTKLRPVIQAEILLKGKRIKAQFTLADRQHMKYKVLIGQNALRQGFLIDPRQK